MTLVDDRKRPSPPAKDAGADPDLTVICPYLASADGSWRSTTAAREHRCGAVSPPALLAAEKQRRLCLTDDHLRCATFEAARAARPIAQDRAATLPRPLARTTPVVLDHGRISITVPAFRSEQMPAQAILVALLAIAFAAIVLARLTGGGGSAGLGAGASASARASARASVIASPAPRASSLPTQSVQPSMPVATPVATKPPPTARPTTKATRTYRVKAGDTLIGIAAKYRTTVAAIRKLNHLSSGSSLHVGQILKIP
jgi:LysM domain-containing protein